MECRPAKVGCLLQISSRPPVEEQPSIAGLVPDSGVFRPLRFQRRCHAESFRLQLHRWRGESNGIHRTPFCRIATWRLLPGHQRDGAMLVAGGGLEHRPKAGARIRRVRRPALTRRRRVARTNGAASARRTPCARSRRGGAEGAGTVIGRAHLQPERHRHQDRHPAARDAAIDHRGHRRPRHRSGCAHRAGGRCAMCPVCSPMPMAWIRAATIRAFAARIRTSISTAPAW